MVVLSIALGIISIILIITFICLNNENSLSNDTIYLNEKESRLAGMKGEVTATNIIRKTLRTDDYLYTNIKIECNGKRAEIDNVVVNKYGVFIFEVKNYNGTLIGNENDYEWMKVKITQSGNKYTNTVKNPIKQVKRQVYILAKYLDHYGKKVWVDGYIIFLMNNSPINSEYVMKSAADVDRVIHTRGKNRLNMKDVDEIRRLING